MFREDCGTATIRNLLNFSSSIQPKIPKVQLTHCRIEWGMTTQTRRDMTRLSAASNQRGGSSKQFTSRTVSLTQRQAHLIRFVSHGDDSNCNNRTNESKCKGDWGREWKETKHREILQKRLRTQQKLIVQTGEHSPNETTNLFRLENYLVDTHTAVSAQCNSAFVYFVLFSFPFFDSQSECEIRSCSRNRESINNGRGRNSQGSWRRQENHPHLSTG